MAVKGAPFFARVHRSEAQTLDGSRGGGYAHCALCAALASDLLGGIDIYTLQFGF